MIHLTLLTCILATSLLRKQELPTKCDTLNTVLALDGNILCTTVKPVLRGHPREEQKLAA